MSQSITITAKSTEELNAATRAAIIALCIMAHQKEDFQHLFPPCPYTTP